MLQAPSRRRGGLSPDAPPRPGSPRARPPRRPPQPRLLVAVLAAAALAVCALKLWAVYGPLPKEMPTLYLKYTAFAGLNNQLGSHVSMLALVSAFNATRSPGDGPVTLVTSLAYSRRNSSQLMFDDFPIDHVLDFDAFSGYWRKAGIDIVKETEDANKCLALELKECTPAKLIFGRETKRHPCMARADLIRLPAVETAAAIRTAVITALGHARGGPRLPDCVAADLGWPAFVASDWRTSWPAAEFFRGFVFPKKVTEAANAVLAALPPFPKPGFAGVHLRIEEDWQPREDREQGIDPVGAVDRYIKAMRRARIGPQTVTYFASGVFARMNDSALAALTGRFVEAGVVEGALSHKESLVPAGIFTGLSMEQLALVDLLVLMQASVVVGDKRSTFFENLKYMREGDGAAASSSFSVV